MDKISDLPVRLSNKIKNAGDCWIWTGTKNKGGYGQFGSDGKIVSVHRYVWKYFNGGILNGLFVLHKCDVRNCVNPDHLFLGTAKDNAVDKVSKGRGAKGKRSGRHTHPESVPRGENHSNSKLTQIQVDEIRNYYRKGKRGGDKGYSQTVLAKRYSVSQQQIGKIVNRKSWAQRIEENKEILSAVTRK